MHGSLVKSSKGSMLKCVVCINEIVGKIENLKISSLVILTGQWLSVGQSKIHMSLKKVYICLYIYIYIYMNFSCYSTSDSADNNTPDKPL